MMKTKTLHRYFLFTKLFYIIWFIVFLLVLAFMSKDVISGNFTSKNLVFQIFSSVVIILTAFAFRNLSLIIRDIDYNRHYNKIYLNKISFLIKMIMITIFIYGCIGYKNGIGLDTINLSPEMILLLSSLGFVFVSFKIFSVLSELNITESTNSINKEHILTK